MLNDPWIAALFALFIWWFSTGAILMAVRYADRRGPRAGHLATLCALPLLAAGVAGILYESTPVLSAETGEIEHGANTIYISFLSALAIWGWIEMAFLTGTVTGPNRLKCPENVPEWERFIRAWGTIAYHEMALVAALIGLWFFARESHNIFAFWTFAVLFFARISAKLNLFLGVPKINTEFLPSALSHLPSHFRNARLNWLFPLSITALSFAVACWLERIYSASNTADIIGFSLLSAFTALALLEHWFMVLPLPDEKLWRWMLPAPKQTNQERRPEDAHGL